MIGPSLVGFGRAAARSLWSSPDLVRAIAPTGWPSPGARQRYQATAAAQAGARLMATQHERWAQFYGSAPPLSAEALDGGVDAERSCRLRALDAGIALEVEAERALATLRRPWSASPAEVVVAIVITSVSLPAVLAGESTSRAAAFLARTAPPLPPVRTPKPDRASLLTSTLAAAVPEILGNAALRHVVLRWPNEITVGVRSGRSASSVTIGRRGIRITNGLARNATIVVDGDVRSVLRRASSALADELAAMASGVDDGRR